MYDYIVFVHLFSDSTGGVQLASKDLCDYITRKDLSVVVVHSGSKDQFYHDKGVDCLSFNTFKIFYGFYPFVGLKMFIASLRLIRQNNHAKIIIYGRHFTESIMAAALCKLLGREYIYIDTGFKTEVFNNVILNLILKILDQTILKLVFIFSTYKIFESHTSRQYVENKYNKQFSKTSVIYNGFDDNITKEYEITPKERKIVFASRLVNIKNPDLVVDAYLCLANQYPDWQFLMVGKGNCKLENIDLKTLPRNITYNNNLLPQEELHQLLAKSYIYINSSFSEGLPLALTEAGALGCLLVMSNIGNNLEIASALGLIKYTFNPNSLSEFIEKLQLAMSMYGHVNHKQIQLNSIRTFANSKRHQKYAKLFGVEFGIPMGVAYFPLI